MPLSKRNQHLKRDLQGISSDLKWSAVELKSIANRLTLVGNELDAQAVIRICMVMESGERRLAEYVEELQRDTGTNMSVKGGAN